MVVTFTVVPRGAVVVVDAGVVQLLIEVLTTPYRRLAVKTTYFVPDLKVTLTLAWVPDDWARSHPRFVCTRTTRNTPLLVRSDTVPARPTG